ncbi:MAG: hypothetical protein F4X80_04780 [Chloroflexi bacterium]|nr:hypothetical protein [Chloroflexota bacterium]
MTDDTRRPARLIPIYGRGTEAEPRVTSALLSVLTAVDEFGKAILRRHCGAPAGKISAFTEVSIKMPGGRTERPDGLVEVRRGNHTWVALVETKTGPSQLDKSQVERYLDAARYRKYDALITISNQIMPVTGEHPVAVSKKKLGRVKLHHISWAALLTEAVMVRHHRGVSDPDQAWILSELIAYLDNPRSGVMQFKNMGRHWTKVRAGARARTLNPGDEGVGDVVARWDEFARFLSLRLGRRLGSDVQRVLSRPDRSDPTGRRSRLANTLARDGVLECTLRVPDAVADITVRADLIARTVSAGLSIKAPERGRPRTRVNWLVRQLRNEPAGNIQVATAFKSRKPVTKLLADLIENPDEALLDDRQIPPREFTLTLARDMRERGGATARSFVQSVEAVIDEFYRRVGQNLKAWTPPAPRLPEQSPSPEVEEPETEASSDSEVASAP